MTELIRNFTHQPKPYTFPETVDRYGSYNVAVGDVQTPHDYFDPSTGFMPFFGIPKSPIFHRPEDSMWRENYRLPDAYKGECAHLNRVLIRRITSEERFPTKKMFPMQF